MPIANSDTGNLLSQHRYGSITVTESGESCSTGTRILIQDFSCALMLRVLQMLES